MPRLMATDKDQVIDITGPGNFQYSAIRIEDLGATEYTLVTIVCDISGSVTPFAVELLECIKTIVKACQKSPRSENLLLRILLFNKTIYEIHGFKNLHEINVNDYEDLEPNYLTALFDATYNGVCATLEYSGRLIAQDFDCNGAVYIITDGMDNQSKMGPSSIKDKITNALANENVIESLNTILIGLHDPNVSWEATVKDELEKFKNEAELTAFLNIGEATAQKLAKLANWVSESISSQSQALRDKTGPSQILAF